MAGPEGYDPSSSVLETDALPLSYEPINHFTTMAVFPQLLALIFDHEQQYEEQQDHYALEDERR